MKPVFHVITTINRGGAENQLLVLVREQLKIGLEVHIVYLKNDPELELEFTQIGAEVHHALSGRRAFLQPIALRKLIGDENPIVHAHLPRAELVSLLCPAKFKLVTSRHNAEPFFPGAPKFLSNFLSRIVELRSTRIIAISEAVKKFLVDCGEIRDRDKIEVVLYGYQTHFLRSQIKNKQYSPIRHIGTISRLTDQKDIPTMLRAFKVFHDGHPGSTLAILGDGPLRVSLEEIVNRMNLSGCVTFFGRSANIYEYLMKLDAFMLTSKYEGFGMVLLEAMDSGIPILASNNSAIPEVLGEDFPGLCITGNPSDFTSKLEKLCDLEFRNTVLDRQEDRLRLFSAEIMCERICEIYSL